MKIHLKDFVWMRKEGEQSIQVDADPVIISRYMNAGFSQCEPPLLSGTPVDLGVGPLEPAEPGAPGVIGFGKE